jgi:hypothetical protein
MRFVTRNPTSSPRKVPGAADRQRAKALAVLGISVVLSVTPLPAKNKKDAARDARITLIRTLGQEIAVTKLALPRGKSGIFVDAQGQVDQDKAQNEMRMHGPAIKPGMPVQITKMEFKSDQLKLELNGGGRKGKKWYQRIEVGMGGSTAPVVQQPSTLAYGSSITLSLPARIEDTTPEQVKQLLAAVLDFERHSPTTLYSPEVPPEIKEAIKNHQVIVGMDRDSVLSSKGPPDRKVREERDGVEQEDWIYGLPPNVLFVTFDGDRVVKVQQY